MAAVATETLPWHLHNEHSPTINSGRNEAPRYRVMRRHKGRAGILKGKTPSEVSTTKQIQCSPHTRGIEEEFPHPCGSRVMEPLSQVQSEDGGERSEPLFFFFPACSKYLGQEMRFSASGWSLSFLLLPARILCHSRGGIRRRSRELSNGLAGKGP